MRLFVILSLFASLLLAACGGSQPAPTEVPANDAQGVDAVTDEQVVDSEPTNDPNIVVVTQAPISLTDNFELEVPMPGTLVASETEDPNAALVFDNIFFTRTGGPEGSERIQIELFQDGRMIYNSQQSMVPIETILRIDAMLDEMNFFGLQNNMMGPQVEGDEYQYGLVVTRGIDTLAVTSIDGYMPTEYERLLGTILNLALRS